MNNNSNGKKRAVVALGGNAISMRDHLDTISSQFQNTEASVGSIVELIKDGYQLALTHGNGPQVGNALMRVELSRGRVPVLPLNICVADLQGGMGFMIEQSLQNRLKQENIERPVVTLISQVLVDENDPAFADPTKFIGQFYEKAEAEKLSAEMGWQKIKQFPGDKRWRRVVPSPKPRSIVESNTIKTLVEMNTIVIAAGGGGIPVIKKDGQLFGVDAVIDKDLASAVLARDIEAELLIILTDIERVAINFGKPDQKNIEKATLAEFLAYRAQGQFPAGSMGPKIDAAIEFLKNGGKKVIITSIEKGFDAVKGKAGTCIVP